MQSSRCIDQSPHLAEFHADVVAGLSRRPRRLPCKYFYDERGSQLFDRICELDEYYLTRTELAIMREYAPEMATTIGHGASLIELGSGSSVKTQLLLDALVDPASYVPVDISRHHLQKSAARLARVYPALRIRPVAADFTRGFRLPDSVAATNRVVYFPGSTIGNFRPSAAQRFLQEIARIVGPGGGLLIGIDLVKERSVLTAAYNDAAGVTAAFNLNLLARIKRELAGSFDLPAFRHLAIYNASRQRIEMHLVSTKAQTVRIGDRRFEFELGETIRTELSHKYTIDQFAALAAPAALRLQHVWTDERRWFAVLYFTVGQAGGSDS
jgi:dimethylhistidine N-methyltransferase